MFPHAHPLACLCVLTSLGPLLFNGGPFVLHKRRLKLQWWACHRRKRTRFTRRWCRARSTIVLRRVAVLPAKSARSSSTFVKAYNRLSIGRPANPVIPNFQHSGFS